MEGSTRYSYCNPSQETDESELYHMQQRVRPTNEDEMANKRSECWNRLVTLVTLSGWIIAVVLVVVFAVLLNTKCKTERETVGGPNLPADRQIGIDWSNGLSLLVDFDETPCREPYCLQCRTNVRLIPPQATEPHDCEEELIVTGCGNCSELLATADNNVDMPTECNGQFYPTRCLTAHTCNSEDLCQGGVHVFDDVADRFFCNCPVGRNGSNCQHTYTAQFQCECYTSFYKLSAWSSIAHCDEATFTEPPDKCRLKVQETGGGQKQCVCKKYEQITDKPECADVNQGV